VAVFAVSRDAAEGVVRLATGGTAAGRTAAARAVTRLLPLGLPMHAALLRAQAMYPLVRNPSPHAPPTAPCHVRIEPSGFNRVGRGPHGGSVTVRLTCVCSQAATLGSKDASAAEQRAASLALYRLCSMRAHRRLPEAMWLCVQQVRAARERERERERVDLCRGGSSTSCL
jgi:hypothetical protein